MLSQLGCGLFFHAKWRAFFVLYKCTTPNPPLHLCDKGKYSVDREQVRRLSLVVHVQQQQQQQQQEKFFVPGVPFMSAFYLLDLC